MVDVTKTSEDRSELARKLDEWFKIFWISLAIGVPALIIVIGIGGVIVAVVFSCIILFHLWSLIPKETAKTTPGRAVGFLFIPLFSFYWNFVAIHGLATSLNVETNKLNIADKKVNEQLSLAFCIVAIASAVLFELPVASILLGIVQAVLFGILLFQMKEAGKSIALS